MYVPCRVFELKGPTINFRYFPVMVSRMMLSLRKAADPGQGDWSLADPIDPSLKSMVFVRPQSTYKVPTSEGQGDESSDV